MRNFVPLILAVSGVFLFDQGHSSNQDSPESSGIVVTPPVNIEDDTSSSRSRGGYLTSKHSNQDLDLSSEAIRLKDRLNRTKRSWGDMGASYEVYTNRERNGTSGYYFPAIIARYLDDIPSISALLNPDQKLYLLVHGWLGSSTSLSNISNSPSSSRLVKDEELAQIKNELLRVENATVIVVDWSEKAEDTYSVARNYSSPMAFGMAWLVKILVEAGALQVSKVHYIGHGLGAQVAGYFALGLKLIMNGQKIGRITGLDPDNEGFEDERLDRDDADFVDVIHTSNGVYELGMREPMGHVDFYPNRGGDQPRCFSAACSHKIAKIYYRKSIEKCTYSSGCCPSGAYISSRKLYCRSWRTYCGRMGHHASSDLRGVHHVELKWHHIHCGV
ncbi:endothelial lipase isoform X2 [Ixodes scapularis]|uniref:endothelial lipase isoform X2 n=1 Tax=Ixodes scapularis TaxID=6945 RepID=UPI001A9FE7DB|nr:endothelial lipase isoform X2 [Ixodes scapularis]